MNKENSIAKLLSYIGIIEIVGGLILGVVLGQDTASYSDNLIWSITLTWWIGGFVSGIMFIGFAEVIELLHRINQKMSTTDGLISTKRELNFNVGKNKDDVPKNYQLRINDFFEKKGLSPLKYIKTPVDKIIYVEFPDNDFRIVKMELVTVKEIPSDSWGEVLTNWIQKIIQQN